MKISTFKHFTSDATKGLSRNKTLTFASIATVATTLLILGVFMMVALNVRIFMDQLGSKMEIRVSLKDDITIQQGQDVRSKIKNSRGFESMEEISKEEAEEIFTEALGKDAEQAKILFQDFLEESPFPVQLKVFASDSKYIDEIVENIKGLEGIDNIRVHKDVIEKISKITSIMKIASIVIFALLFIVSIFLIMNTIKLAVFSRSKEINIMKYVGATDWFIRWPFIIEGIIIGLIGSIISLTLLYGLYVVLFGMMNNVLGFVSFAKPIVILKDMLGLFVIGGVFIGGIGSILSIRRFLKV